MTATTYKVMTAAKHGSALIILALGILRQEDHEFEFSLGYTMKCRLLKTTKVCLKLHKGSGADQNIR